MSRTEGTPATQRVGELWRGLWLTLCENRRLARLVLGHLLLGVLLALAAEGVLLLGHVDHLSTRNAAPARSAGAEQNTRAQSNTLCSPR